MHNTTSSLVVKNGETPPGRTVASSGCSGSFGIASATGAARVSDRHGALDRTSLEVTSAGPAEVGGGRTPSGGRPTRARLDSIRLSRCILDNGSNWQFPPIGIFGLSSDGHGSGSVVHGRIMMNAAIPREMNALVLTSPGQFEIQRVPVPAPAPGEVLCRIRAVAICGSDPEIIRGDLAGTWPPAYPFTPGHEWAGEVVAVGAEVVGFAPGDRVAGEAHKGCGYCRNCLQGRYNLCENYGRPETGHRHYGFISPGAYAQYNAYSIRSVSPLAAGGVVPRRRAGGHRRRLAARDGTGRHHARRNRRRHRARTDRAHRGAVREGARCGAGDRRRTWRAPQGGGREGSRRGGRLREGRSRQGRARALRRAGRRRGRRVLGRAGDLRAVGAHGAQGRQGRRWSACPPTRCGRSCPSSTSCTTRSRSSGRGRTPTSRARSSRCWRPGTSRCKDLITHTFPLEDFAKGARHLRQPPRRRDQGGHRAQWSGGMKRIRRVGRTPRSAGHRHGRAPGAGAAFPTLDP